MINAAQGIWVPKLVFSNTDEKINTKNDEKTFAVARYRELFFEADICLIRVPKPLVRVPHSTCSLMSLRRDAAYTHSDLTVLDNIFIFEVFCSIHNSLTI